MPSYLKLHVQLESPTTTTLKVYSLLYLGPNKYRDIIYVTLIKKKQIGSTNPFSSVNNFSYFQKKKTFLYSWSLYEPASSAKEINWLVFFLSLTLAKMFCSVLLSWMKRLLTQLFNSWIFIFFIWRRSLLLFLQNVLAF